MAWPRLGQVEVDSIVQLRYIRLARCWPWSMFSGNAMASAASAPACCGKEAVGGSDRCWPTVQNGPGANSAAGTLLRRLGFAPISETLRMYRGYHPEASLADVYGLACLGLG
jgi:hypothetical protein